jgi:DNA mismatch repair ATPase MutL
MKEGNSSETVRCSKARAMFAMRACRSSIMIGTALKHRHMTNVSDVKYISHHRSSRGSDGSKPGWHGSTLELSPWKTNYAASVQPTGVPNKFGDRI